MDGQKGQAAFAMEIQIEKSALTSGGADTPTSKRIVQFSICRASHPSYSTY